VKHIDLYAGLAAFLYALVAFILAQQGIADLSEFVATPEAAGTFALVALGRFYTQRNSIPGSPGKE
jgi:hypothetical protein